MATNGTFRILDSVEIAMRDGTILRANVWLPGDTGQWPVLLQRTAYSKDDAFGTQYIPALEFMAALRRGYAIAVQDTRGRYGSDGAFVPFAHKAEDGTEYHCLAAPAELLQWPGDDVRRPMSGPRKFLPRPPMPKA